MKSALSSKIDVARWPEPFKGDICFRAQVEGKDVLFRTNVQDKHPAESEDGELCIFDANSHWQRKGI